MRRTVLYPTLLLALLAGGCGGASTERPDDAAWFHAGVDPQAEAAAILGGLERAGYTLALRIEGDGWIALDARRGDELRAIRVITSRGAALVLDSHEPDGVIPRHGQIELVAPERARGHDLDADGHDEIVVGAMHRTQRCLLPFRVSEAGELRPLAPELGDLGAEVCVESIRDVDGDERMEGVAVVRLDALARGDDVPTIDAPLELDSQGRFRTGPPAVGFVAEERAARARELDGAVHELDAERVYRLAIELAALARIAGNGRDAQLHAFDHTISRVVLSESLAAAVRAARAVIERGWDVGEPPASD